MQVFYLAFVALVLTFVIMNVIDADDTYVPPKKTHVYVCEGERRRNSSCEHYTVDDPSIIADSPNFDNQRYYK